MKDTIYREDAIDVIKFEDKWLFDAKSHNEDTKIAFSSMESKISELPSAQPEIIYCGECTKMQVDNAFHDCWCGETGKKVWINHYCGYAERRTDDEG